jgi:hypothetical protein
VLGTQIVAHFSKFIFDEVLIVEGSEDRHGHVVNLMMFIEFFVVRVFVSPSVWLFSYRIFVVNLADRKLVNHDLEFHVLTSFYTCDASFLLLLMF